MTLDNSAPAYLHYNAIHDLKTALDFSKIFGDGGFKKNPRTKTGIFLHMHRPVYTRLLRSVCIFLCFHRGTQDVTKTCARIR